MRFVRGVRRLCGEIPVNASLTGKRAKAFGGISASQHQPKWQITAKGAWCKIANQCANRQRGKLAGPWVVQLLVSLISILLCRVVVERVFYPAFCCCCNCVATLGIAVRLFLHFQSFGSVAGLAATCAQFFSGSDLVLLGSSSTSIIRSREGFCYGGGAALLR
ncbi:hypothetical protein Nepgr_004015 [Nepenthes gracilis]|uniref:Uncharacterized protein n=1 Tax=Nepenthes gracilis TaxID=150966 RepID=A0AAD3XES3_NEPGR|nr:hypothetical protein Nepgr_004015 [Nepenthes gracilis]